ncbi:hypothetical protein [Verrucomicrobium sp. BvORR034]|uniref:hypothetical protein n=1 Tax=Verrucomicrobium sp. BvORR034 TaxID=1396418 RepID=UPI000AB73A58|nr:hypothetical protein [Verrucomicrobium sp. BvORR034]
MKLKHLHSVLYFVMAVSHVGDIILAVSYLGLSVICLCEIHHDGANRDESNEVNAHEED